MALLAFLLLWIWTRAGISVNGPEIVDVRSVVVRAETQEDAEAALAIMALSARGADAADGQKNAMSEPASQAMIAWWVSFGAATACRGVEDRKRAFESFTQLAAKRRVCRWSLPRRRGAALATARRYGMRRGRHG